ncbi:hypothetical protein OHB41_00780 [Streptomyces sp. NBC_01571]|uniref:COG4315 family predicted lipoprotein n=1 Tax=Streptomyces sp. NBC_01571 TaxID=2975883 RepID=UPI00225810D7|nr:hypothetical protein [Streptomyces sp. NBC_01571]MCX4571766.1 hypothetical protein [Streptomyces sp. NBC_01571]
MSVDHDGMTLYTFDRHHDSRSLHTGETMRWPALPAGPHHDEPMKKWTRITRNDGTMQWAYDGKPLYTFVKDKKTANTPGDGDGMKDVLPPARP